MASKKKKGGRLTLAIVGIAAAGVFAATALRPAHGAPPPGSASLGVGASPTSGAIPLTVGFSGSYEDENGVGIPGAVIYLFENPNATLLTTFTTISDGTFAGSFTFTTAGMFSVFVSDDNQGL